MKIVPIRKNLLVEPIQKEAVTKGGIIIPDSSDHGAKGLTKGRVVAIAEDCDVRRYGFKVGGVVLFNKFSYTEIKLPPLEAGQSERSVLLVNEDKIEGRIDD